MILRYGMAVPDDNIKPPARGEPTKRVVNSFSPKVMN